MRRAFPFLFLLVLLGSLSVPGMAHVAGEEADTVYLNGNIYTVDEAFSVAEAFAIKGDRFIYVGSNEGAKEFIGTRTAVIDLEGKTVVPGLHDSHNHFTNIGEKLNARDISIYWKSVQEIRDIIQHAIETGEEMRPKVGDEPQWLVLDGYFEGVWEPKVFHKSLFDDISPDTPIYFRRYTHGGAANSKALEIAGITKDTPDPEGGMIVRDENGEPTGELTERATRLVTQHIPPWPPWTEEELRNNLVTGSEHALSKGLTVIHDASGASMDEVNRRSALYEEGRLKIRLNNMLSYGTALQLGAPEVRFDNRYFLKSVKVMSDGALGVRGAAMIDEYTDMPGYYGELLVEEDSFAAQVAELLRLGFSTRTHAIGDMGNRVTINAYEKALNMTGIDGKDARLALEHCQIVHPDDFARIRDLGIVASMQAIHAIEDKAFAEDRIGTQRVQERGYQWRRLLDLGVVIANGSDYSVSPLEPFFGMHAAITRQDRDYNPPGGWFPEKCMTREEALRSYTNGGVYVMFAEDILGSIEVGKLADFVVIDRDYMTCPIDDIWKIEVLMTVVGGEVVYTVLPLFEDINIKPNSINLKSKGVVTVELLSSDVFDASNVNPDSVQFAGAAPVRWKVKDVNNDGKADMWFQFNTQDLVIDGSISIFWATLHGVTNEEEAFQATDVFKLVPKK